MQTPTFPYKIQIENTQKFLRENQSIVIAILSIVFLLTMVKITRITSASSVSTQVIDVVQ